jgi:hypothetical protein
MKQFTWIRLFKAAAVCAVLGVIGLFLLARYDVPTRVQEWAIKEGPQIYRRLRPIRVRDSDVLTELQAANLWTGASAAKPSGFWEEYRRYRASARPRALISPGTIGPLMDSLRAAYPQVAAEIVELAGRYRQGQLGTFERWSDQLGKDFTWTTYPAFNDDVLLIWEANTLQHFTIMAQAFLLSGDTTYLHAIGEQLTSWNDENPVEASDNWLAQMEVSLRMISLLWTHDLLVESPEAAALFPELTRQILSHARFVARRIDAPRRRNNHGLFIAMGLWLVGDAYPEFKSSAQWRSFGEARVLEEIGLQYANGVHIERAPTYQKALFDGLVQMLSTYLREGKPAPEALSASLADQRRVLEVMTGPDGRIARFRDSDDHRYTVLAPRPYTDAGGSAAIYDLVAGVVPEHPSCAALWEAALLRAVAARPACTETPGRRTSNAIVADTAGGFSKLVVGPWTLIADFATYGGRREFLGHSHADIGTYELWHEQNEVVIDPGTYTYRQPRIDSAFSWRDYFRSSRAHNLILVNEKGQAEPTAEFGLSGWHPASITALWKTSDGALVAGTHAAYDSVAGSSARIFLLEPAGVTVVDWFPRSQAELSYESIVHTAGTSAAQTGTGVRLSNAVTLGFDGLAGPLQPEIAKEGKPFAGGWRSRNYGEIEPIATVRAQARFSGPAALAARLSDGSTATPVRLRTDGTTLEISRLVGSPLRFDSCVLGRGDPAQAGACAPR